MRIILVVTTLLALLSFAVADGHLIIHTQSAVMTHPLRGDVTPVEGAEAHLVRSAAGITVVFATRDLIPGNVYTAWLVFIDDPAACAASPCTVPEVNGTPDLVRSNITFGDSLIAPEDGTGTFVAHLEPGEIQSGWFGNAFTNPMGAEVHVGLHNHGPVITSLRDEMLTSYRAGCTDASLPSPPATAIANGTPGPNTCQMWQFTIFEAPGANFTPTSALPSGTRGQQTLTHTH